jgi:hypothetical protein
VSEKKGILTKEQVRGQKRTSPTDFIDVPMILLTPSNLPKSQRGIFVTT